MNRTIKLVLGGVVAPAATLAVLLGATSHSAPAHSAPAHSAPAAPAATSSVVTCAAQLNPAGCTPSTHGG